MLKNLILQIRHHKQIAQFKKHINYSTHHAYFTTLYAPYNGYLLAAANKQMKPDLALTYGEVAYLPFAALLSQVHPCPQDIYFDLGSGLGKSCLIAALSFKLTHCIGIELVSALHQAAVEVKQACGLSLQRQITFRHENLLNTDLTNATIVYINATGFFGHFWHALVDKLQRELQTGTRIILTSKTLTNRHFIHLKQIPVEMSYGIAHANIYRKL